MAVSEKSEIETDALMIGFRSLIQSHRESAIRAANRWISVENEIYAASSYLKLAEKNPKFAAQLRAFGEHLKEKPAEPENTLRGDPKWEEKAKYWKLYMTLRSGFTVFLKQFAGKNDSTFKRIMKISDIYDWDWPGVWEGPSYQDSILSKQGGKLELAAMELVSAGSFESERSKAKEEFKAAETALGELKAAILKALPSSELQQKVEGEIAQLEKAESQTVALKDEHEKELAEISLEAASRSA